jgi:hypothetical protein
MNLDFNIHLDVTSYEADLIKEGLKSLLRRRYEEHRAWTRAK